ncbi:hypothetical protein V6Z11_D10G202200 [Gossypium hirsutum]
MYIHILEQRGSARVFLNPGHPQAAASSTADLRPLRLRRRCDGTPTTPPTVRVCGWTCKRRRGAVTASCVVKLLQ